MPVAALSLSLSLSPSDPTPYPSGPNPYGLNPSGPNPYSPKSIGSTSTDPRNPSRLRYFCNDVCFRYFFLLCFLATGRKQVQRIKLKRVGGSGESPPESSLQYSAEGDGRWLQLRKVSSYGKSVTAVKLFPEAGRQQYYIFLIAFLKLSLASADQNTLFCGLGTLRNWKT